MRREAASPKEAATMAIVGTADKFWHAPLPQQGSQIACGVGSGPSTRPTRRAGLPSDRYPRRQLVTNLADNAGDDPECDRIPRINRAVLARLPRQLHLAAAAERCGEENPRRRQCVQSRPRPASRRLKLFA